MEYEVDRVRLELSRLSLDLNHTTAVLDRTRAELFRIRGERDRLFLAVSEDTEDMDQAFRTILDRIAIPDAVAAALAEHDRKFSGEGSE